MKRAFSIMLMGVTMMSVTSCFGSGNVLDKIKNLLKGEDEVVEEVAYEYVEEPVSENRMYSNSYDGYTNVRQSASAKSAVLGKLRNGNEYVNVIGQEGNWYEVEYYDMIGYVHKDYVSRNPSQPVTVDVDAKWLEGVWGCYDGYQYDHDYFLVFSNGKFVKDHSNGTIGYGRWRLEGNEIVFTIKRLADWGEEINAASCGDTYRLEIKKGARMLSGFAKHRLVDDEYTDGTNKKYNKSAYNELKKEANKYVK